MAEAIRPGATLGILGGGQLGRMLVLAAATLGLKTHVFCPDEDSPAFDVATRHTIADYTDAAALAAFARSCEVVTFEFENVPDGAAEAVARGAPFRPGPRALAATQDRLVEKRFVADLGIGTAPFVPIGSPGELAVALSRCGGVGILKTRRFGYDGKGQARLTTDCDPQESWTAIGSAPAILEGLVAFVHEVSIVAARGQDGGFAAYDVCLNRHENGILAETIVPAGLIPALADEAVGIARRIADALHYVGVLAVEMFVVGEGAEARVLVNEIAPRVHNSGHWTVEGAETSQFEQHVRAVCGWPLGSVRTRAPATMTNLIGDAIEAWPAILAEHGAHLHHYGKAVARPGRKMGHVTRLRGSGR